MVEVIKYSQSELSFILEGSFCFYLFAIFTKRLKKKERKRKKPVSRSWTCHILYHRCSCMAFLPFKRKKGKKGFDPEKIKYIIIPRGGKKKKKGKKRKGKRKKKREKNHSRRRQDVVYSEMFNLPRRRHRRRCRVLANSSSSHLL